MHRELGPQQGDKNRGRETMMVESNLVSAIILSALLMFYGRKGAEKFPCHVEDVDFKTSKVTVRVEASRMAELETALAFYVVHQGVACRVRRWTARDDAYFAQVASNREILSMEF